MVTQPPPAEFAPSWNYAQTLREASAIIQMMGMQAVLRRGIAGTTQTDRWCKVFIRRWRSREMAQGLINPLSRFALVSGDVQPPPDHEQDRLVTFLQPMGDVPVEDEILRIVARPEAIKPAGILVAWKLEVLW